VHDPSAERGPIEVQRLAGRLDPQFRLNAHHDSDSAREPPIQLSAMDRWRIALSTSPALVSLTVYLVDLARLGPSPTADALAAVAHHG
jgi:hypothetical protein